MTTLSLHAPVLPRVKFGGFGRLIAVAVSALVLNEAQQMANEAWRFPYGRS